MRGTRAGRINHFQATGRQEIRAPMNFIGIRVAIGDTIASDGFLLFPFLSITYSMRREEFGS